MNEYEARKNAREDLTRVICEHEKKLGHLPNEEKARRLADERADRIDKKQDRNIKG